MTKSNALLVDQLAMIAEEITLSKESGAEKKGPTAGRGRQKKTYDEALNAVKVRAAEVVKRKQIDFESRILQESFPGWDDELRGIPNPFIRSGLFSVRNTKLRPFIENMAVASLSNYDIRYRGSELQQDDLSVWVSLINLARSTPLSDKVRFSGYQIVKDLGWRMHSESYKRVRESIERLQVTGITIETKNQSEGYAGPLIREYAWADLDEKGDAKWMVRFEPRVSMLFVNDSTTLLEWEMRKKIGTRATLAQFLHAFYTSHREPIPLALKKLHELSRSGATLSTFRRNIVNALQTLVDVGLLSSFDTTKDIVRVVKRSQLQLIVGTKK